MGKRTSQLTQLTAAQVAQGDFLPIVDVSAGQTKYVTVKDLTGLPDTGWLATGESWAYSSWNSTLHTGVITVPTDATTKYAIGMWVRFSQTTGGTKWGKIVSITLTTLTVNFPNGVTFTNETLTSPVYSPLERPVGSPDNSQFIHSMTNAGSGGGTLYFRYDNGIKEVWGTTAVYSGAGGSQTTYGITFPTGFFSTNPNSAVANTYNLTSNARQWFFVQNNASTAGVSLAALADGAYGGYMSYRVVGS